MARKRKEPDEEDTSEGNVAGPEGAVSHPKKRKQEEPTTSETSEGMEAKRRLHDAGEGDITKGESSEQVVLCEEDAHAALMSKVKRFFYELTSLTGIAYFKDSCDAVPRTGRVVKLQSVGSNYAEILDHIQSTRYDILGSQTAEAVIRK
jgi:hypothetical protein